MSDDTATVDPDLIEGDAEKYWEHGMMVHRAMGPIAAELERQRLLIEQQARTIAEQAERSEGHTCKKKKRLKHVTHRSSSGTKLYPIFDKKGRFMDIKVYVRAHRKALKKAPRK